MSVLIVILIVTLLSVNSNKEDPFIFPKEEKLVKHAIQDPERRKEAVHIMKIYKKDWKQLQKMRKKHEKAVKKLNKDFNADTHDMEQLLEELREKRRRLKDDMAEIRLNFQQLLTSDEWEELISQIDALKEKRASKKERKEIKAELKRNKMLSKIEAEIEAAFTDPEKVEEVRRDLDQFEEDLSNLMFAMQEEPAELMKVIRNQNATYEELTEIIEKLDNYLIQMQASFLTLRSELQELSSEDQWRKIAKALNKLI